MATPDTTFNLVQELETAAITLLSSVSTVTSPSEAFDAVHTHGAAMKTVLEKLFALGKTDIIAETLSRTVPRLLAGTDEQISTHEEHAAAVRAFHVLASQAHFIREMCEINGLSITDRKGVHITFRPATIKNDIGDRTSGPGWVPQMGAAYAEEALGISQKEIDTDAYRSFLITNSRVMVAKKSVQRHPKDNVGFVGGVLKDHSATSMGVTETTMEGQRVRVRRGTEYAINAFGYDTNGKLDDDITVATIARILEFCSEHVLAITFPNDIPLKKTGD